MSSIYSMNTKKKISNLICFTMYGESGSLVQHAIDEGVDAMLAIAKNHDDIYTKGEKIKKETPEEKVNRLKVWQGLVPTIDADQCVKSLLKIPPMERGSYFLFFDLNVLFKYAEQLKGKGFMGNFPTEEDRTMEADRNKAKEFVRKQYESLALGEVKEFKAVEEAIAFLEESDESWVLKGYDDAAETVVPGKNDSQKNKAQLVSALTSGKGEYEKSGFILERKIMNPCELTPQMVCYDGVPVYYSLDIELKKKGAGDLGSQVGCAANLVFALDENDPIVDIAFPKKVKDMAKEHEGMFIWDASILIDPNDGKMYFGEFCSNRPGWDSIQTEIAMGGGVIKYLESVVNGVAPFHKGTYGFAVRMFSESNGEIGIECENEFKNNIWGMYVYKGEAGMCTTGYSKDAVVVTGTGESIIEAADMAYEIAEHGISMENELYRPIHDIFSRIYAGSIVRRYEDGLAYGLYFSDPFEENPEMYIIKKELQEKFELKEKEIEIRFLEQKEKMRQEYENLSNTITTSKEKEVASLREEVQTILRNGSY